MKKLEVVVKGISPMLMHSCNGVNPMNPFTKEIKKLTAKGKNKTDEDNEIISNLEFQCNIYFDEKVGPYVPAENIEACLREAAKKVKLGKAFQTAVMVMPEKIAVEYDGPRDMEGLVNDPNYRDCRPVGIKQNKTMRTRPRFNSWVLRFDIEYSPDIIKDDDAIVDALKTAGAYVGLNDYRPRYGRFEVIEVKKEKCK